MSRLKSIELNLSLPNTTISSCFLFFYFITDLYFLIPAEIVQILISTAELVMPTETNETVETTKGKSST